MATRTRAAPLPATLPGRSARYRYHDAARSANTHRLLETWWRLFGGWADGVGARAFPCAPATLEAYLIALADAGRATATIEQACWAIDCRHRDSGLPTPGSTQQVRSILAGIRRTLGTAQRRAAPLRLDDLAALPEPETLRDLRDRALLLVAIAGGFRCGELVAMRREHLTRAGAGYQVLLPRSKSDQEGRGAVVEIVPARRALALCPVAALDRWRDAARLGGAGPLFLAFDRHGRPRAHGIGADTIYRLVKRTAAACGFDPARFSCHSTRAGCATMLLERGVPVTAVARHLRHQKLDTTLKYDRGEIARAIEGAY